VGDEGAAALGAALGGSSLVELDLGECRISNAGARLFVRGVQMHGAPSLLKVLLLDGNLFGDAGIVDLISLIEGPSRPPALAAISVQPSAPHVLSDEVNAALHVVCDLCHVELRGAAHSAGYCGQPEDRSYLRRAGLHIDDGSSAPNLSGLMLDRSGFEAQTPPLQWGHAAAVEAQSLLPHAAAAGGGGGGMAFPRSPQGSLPQLVPHWWASATPGRAPSTMNTPDVRSGRSSGHLAAWMAGTERELRELKWLLGASAARLDGQHARLMSELDKLRGQLDMWARAGSASGGSPGGDESRLEVLEARFDALEQLVGREQSECAQMWQLVEVAAGAGAEASHSASHEEPARDCPRPGEP